MCIRDRFHARRLEALRAAARELAPNATGASSSSADAGRIGLRVMQRWLTPHESGYESDSSFESSAAGSLSEFASADAGPGAAFTPTAAEHGAPAETGMRLPRGSAQTRMLLETRDAISRVSNFCQAVADPDEPGARERRELLLRASRVIAELVPVPIEGGADADADADAQEDR